MCLCTRPSRNCSRLGRKKTPFAKETDFLFPSLKADGKVPISPAVFVADHLRPAAKAAGLGIPEATVSAYTISGTRSQAG